MTPDQLFNYAVGYAAKSVANGKGTQYPSFRDAARRFRVKQSDIEDACNDYSGKHYMQPAVGIRAGGSGVGDLEGGDRQVEAYLCD